ncbi:hypothetical protein MVEN_01253600 [Mycena venus]|uniref:RNase III domain-containing protein n=1 Tax=Mycena venus TaxID=2733690 RepID=A0A8H6Y6P0_9AGAR|nr:hypothetical protein MVEN_01253600 [Mycena venus]
MNKVWKKKWKQQLEHNGHEKLGGSGSSVPSLASSEPAPPVDFQAVAPSAHSGTKRSQTEASLDSSIAPPLKKLKADAIIVEPDGGACCPSEIVLLYEKVHGQTETELFHHIHSLDPSEAVFRRQFRQARQVRTDVGMCAADLVWRRELKNIDVDIPVYSEEEDDDGPLEILNKTKAKVRDTIKNWAFTMPNLDPNSRGLNVTPKFLRLVQILKSCESYGEDFRGLVFVKLRATAFAISDLIPMLEEHVAFIRPYALTGQGALLVDDKKQQDVFRRFNLGIYNLLIVTKSAEDLDVPKATVVIRGLDKTDELAGPNGGVQVYARQAPLFWSHPTGVVTSLFPLIITVKHSNQPPHAPILLLTRHPLPDFPSFKLFISGSPIIVQCYRGAPFSIDDGKLLSLYMYTLRLCRAVANKPFSCPSKEMPYFLAPVSSSWTPPNTTGRWEHSGAADHIPWDLVARGALSWAEPLKYGRPEDVAEDITDAVIQDRSTELTRRYDVLRVRPDLSPLSHPKDSPREAKYANLLEYCKAVRMNFEGLKDEGQALIELSSVLSGVGRLDPASRSSVEMGVLGPRYLIPELCYKFTIPASTFRTALLFPSIIRRLDSFLLVKELNARYFSHQISEQLLDMAITAPATRMEYDYERLELLGVYFGYFRGHANLTRLLKGDALLKYMASTYVFVTEPSIKEGALHTARQHIVSNNTLFRSFDSAGLPAYVQSKPFSSKSWQPPSFKTSEENQVKTESNRQRKEYEQRLGDKICADVAEAILAAAYLSGGTDTALMAAKAMHIPFPNAETWSDFDRKLLIPPPTVSAKLKPGALQAVETIINHKFKHPHILAQALTHASMSGFESVSYERLEFIGDAVLEFLVLRHVFESNPKLSPGGLTLLKGAMVSNSILAAICVASGLHKHLLVANQLASSVTDYIGKLETKQAEEYELARLEKRSPGQYWQEIEPPKASLSARTALSDVVESVIGAIYVSDNFTTVGVDAFFESVLKPFYDKHITLRTVAHHPTKVLFELIQAQRCQKFQLSKEKAPTGMYCHVLVHDVILATGEGPSISLAARSASWCALDALEGDAEFLRICDCPKGENVKGRNTKGFDEILSGLEE